jgi:hypothetical protein
MFCQSCKEKFIEIDTKTNNIWGFNPYYFNTYKLMKEGFRNFYNNVLKDNNEEEFYRVYNKDGYTYTQWYIYIISKNYYKFKDLKKQTLWLFQIMESYDFFKKIIYMGKKEDHHYTTLHHFLKYLDNMGIYQKNILKLLIDNDLNLDDEDGDNISGHEYLTSKMLTEEDINTTRKLTREYKSDEEFIFSYDIFKDDCFIRCEQCNNFINIYEDLRKNISKIESFNYFNEILSRIINIIKKRKDCLDIYKKYEKLDNSTQRHSHIIEIYKSIFNLYLI